MPKPRQDTKANEMYNLYKQGYSLQQVGNAFCITRQSVYKMFISRNYILRPKRKPLPFVIWMGKKYTKRKDGYFRMTYGTRAYLHRDKWEHLNGTIPDGYDIHHKDCNRENNHVANLLLVSCSDHGTMHGFGGNQFRPAGKRGLK